MYQEFYKFTREPFRLSPEHGFAYSHQGFAKARAYLDYAFMRAEGFVMITGRPGTGKTTLIEALVNDLAYTPVHIANLVCTQLQADDLLKMVAYEFGVPESVVEKGELLQRLTKQLRLWHRDGRRALLIVDEAQDLAISAMEELRLLTNIQMQSRPLLQIFLLGQPELRELIHTPQLEQVHQRIIAASHIDPLEKDETEAYIRHRLAYVHWRGDPAISKSVYPLVYKFSEGVPRRINLICSRLLLHCAVEEKHRVTVEDVREVIKELQNEKLATGEGFKESDFQVEDVFDEPEPESVPEAKPDVVEEVEAETEEKANAEAIPVPQEKDEDIQDRVVEPIRQRKAASGAGQIATMPEPRRKRAKNPPPETGKRRTPQVNLQEVKKKSSTRPTVKADWTPREQEDADSAAKKKLSRPSWSLLTILDVGISIVMLLLVIIGIFIGFLAWG